MVKKNHNINDKKDLIEGKRQGYSLSITEITKAATLQILPPGRVGETCWRSEKTMMFTFYAFFYPDKTICLQHVSSNVFLIPAFKHTHRDRTGQVKENHRRHHVCTQDKIRQEVSILMKHFTLPQSDLHITWGSYTK